MLIATMLVAVLGALAPMAVSSPANAVSRHTWERLAHCESGGRWHLNTHNGYYGGLQFSSSTWRGYGGRRYAHQASGASKHHQIHIARKVKRSQGWKAWPVCSRKIGLR
jgi:hypothetical protein